MRRNRALVEAVRLISAKGHDLDAVLGVLTEQSRLLLGADAVGLHLAAPGGRLRRRHPHPLASPGSLLAATDTEHPMDGWAASAVAAGRSAFLADFQSHPDVLPEARASLPSVVAALVVPLLVDGELVGLLFADWTRPVEFEPAQLEIADALGAHAAVAIGTARLVEEARAARAAEAAARAELEAVFDAFSDGVTVWAPDGRLLRANPPAAAGVARDTGSTEPSAAAYLERTEVRRADGSRLERPVFEPALRGAHHAEELLVRASNGAFRRLHVAAAPILGAHGVVIGAVVVSRDITRFHDAVAERSRLDGAVKAARALAHEMTQHLSLLVGYGQMMADLPPADAAEAAREMGQAAIELGTVVARLQRIVRFEETDTPLGPMLDIEAAMGPG